ncbi:MAG TPA: outer membrane beta-barrel protein [Cyclobacteriaceae bacterium]|nr:outer membrane beta-barrel protein [Cyclobacteriaceae bacterium]
MTERRLRNVSIVFLFFVAHLSEAQHIESYGVFMGMNFPFTIDQGLRKDTRYFARLTLRATPVGFSYGYDKVGHGFVVTPSLVKLGQKYTIQNTQGGEVGVRDIQMDYLSVPVALKLHLNDLAFFRLSVIAAANFDYLLSGKEVVTHEASKQRYPPGVIIPVEPGYSVVYDGVFVPEVSKQVHVSKDKFKPFQLSAAVGFRSDFDFNENWSMNFDGRAIFGIFDPRKTEYIEELKGGSSSKPAPDLYGQRREASLSVTIGISRIFQIKQKHQPKVSTRPSGASVPLRNKKPRHK